MLDIVETAKKYFYFLIFFYKSSEGLSSFL